MGDGRPDPRLAFREEHGENIVSATETRKRCRHCGETKDASDFRRSTRTRDGLSSWCGECHNGASRRWREKQRALVDEALEARRRALVRDLRAQARARKARERREVARWRAPW